MDFHLSLTEAENKALEELADYLRGSPKLGVEVRPGARREEMRGKIADSAGAYEEESGLADWLSRRKAALAEQRAAVNKAIMAAEPGSEHRYRLILDLVDVLGRLEAEDTLVSSLEEIASQGEGACPEEHQ